MHENPSITTCLRYESSIVGSYVSTKWFRHSYWGVSGRDEEGGKRTDLDR